ncbi:MAG TPA: alpha-1,4-glucan--maltose-1-phosphate maltosyltransferase [Solirubrobacteraceae bacterium]|nr:alpha-1,4-glucan--maltose-1-phosphate maltosyltransferase [Solirubrobacteraceae bacterium]
MPKPPALPSEPPPRIRVAAVRPQLDGGRWPVKRCAGDTVRASADVFRDGHEVLRAAVQFRSPGRRRWEEAPMAAVDAHHAGVRWEGEFPVAALGRWSFRVVAWVDPLATWLDELRRKLEAGQEGDLAGELSEGVPLLRAAAARARGADARALTALADGVGEGGDPAALLAPAVLELSTRHGVRTEEVVGDELPVQVDPLLARFGSWYELFPRSWGGFAGVRDQLPRLAELGFDVLYLPPIHPIGRTNRKGPNNALVAGAGDPGSPWAIGAAEGGHADVHPELGTVADFEALVADARAHGIEVALDLALQCSADHPWLTEHPEWFFRRPDGTLKYAENPPKRYQDIYNLNFDSRDWRGLWRAILGVVRCWIARGVRVFRVDNPHTKPIGFWEWLLASVAADDPDVIFLSEAFTRRAVMRELAKAGFHQSYTYFTWKSSHWELTEYVTELASSGEEQYFRPNFFVNTPDILTAELQHGGPPAFALRAVLAATLAPSWGMYSGFEHFEREPLREGSEEYLDSEKYQLRARDLQGPLLPLIARLNAIRRENPAFARLANIRFLVTHNDSLLAYAKREGSNLVVVVVNLDPHTPQEGLVTVPYELGTAPTLHVTDLLDGVGHHWRLGGNYVRLDPTERPAHVMRVEEA